MDEEQYLDTILEEFKQIVQSHFTDFINPNSGYSGANFHIKTSNKNSDFISTPFYYNKPLRFVHFTNIHNLISILNSRSIRLYNLIHSEDEEEFNYAAKILGLNPEEQLFYKEYAYSFSFCEAKELHSKFMWNEYGKRFKGVAIEFEIINNPKDWVNYHISNIYYELPESFKNFHREMEELKEKYKGAKFEYDIMRMIGFFKKNRFSNEKEIRISTYFPFKTTSEILKYTYPDFKIDGNRNRISNYLNLPLYVNNESAYIESLNDEFNRKSRYDETFFQNRPKIKIKNLHFGEKCGLSQDELIKFTQAIDSVLKYKFGYENIQLPFNFLTEEDCI